MIFKEFGLFLSGLFLLAASSLRAASERSPGEFCADSLLKLSPLVHSLETATPELQTILKNGAFECPKQHLCIYPANEDHAWRFVAPVRSKGPRLHYTLTTYKDAVEKDGQTSATNVTTYYDVQGGGVSDLGAPQSKFMSAIRPKSKRWYKVVTERLSLILVEGKVFRSQSVDDGGKKTEIPPYLAAEGCAWVSPDQFRPVYDSVLRKR